MTEPIAVVGMGCRLPGGVNTPAQYWQLLHDGVSGVVRVPAERWDADAFFSDGPHGAGHDLQPGGWIPHLVAAR